MAKGEVNLKYALDKDGNLVHVDKVPNGLDCNCFCPKCKDKLKARHEGKKYAHCFAHLPGADCVGAVESALHKMAKEVLLREKKIILPATNTSASRLLRFDEVKSEVHYPELKLRPDCVGYYGDKVLWIEFKRSHEVDVKKKGKIISAKIDCIEIDINGCQQDFDEVKTFLTDSDSSRIWIYNSEYQYSSPSEGKKRNITQFDYESEYKRDRLIKRRFALEELGDDRRFVDVLRDEIDQNTHTYYCPSCKKEVTLDVTKHNGLFFVHVNPEETCTDIQYLHGAAREAIRYKFMSSEQFVMKLPSIACCEYYDKCRLFSESKCCQKTLYPHDIKKYKYNRCILNYKNDSVDTPSNMAFLREDDTHPIFLTIQVPECDNQSIVTEERCISLQVDSQYDIINFFEQPISGENFNFNPSRVIDKSLNISHYVSVFELYPNGSFKYDKTNCNYLHIDNYKKQPFHGIIKMSIEYEDKNINYLQCLFVWYCIKNELHINKCLLCKHYRSRLNAFYDDAFYCSLTNKDTWYDDPFVKCDNARIDIDTFHALENGVEEMKIHIIKRITIPLSLF